MFPQTHDDISAGYAIFVRLINSFFAQNIYHKGRVFAIHIRSFIDGVVIIDDRDINNHRYG